MNEAPWYKVAWCRLAHRRVDVQSWGSIRYYTCSTCGRRWSRVEGRKK
jgi:hypothetical protein